MSEEIDVQARQKAGKWGHEKKFRWVSRERMEEMCSIHKRIIVRRIFFGRRVEVVQDSRCYLRAIVRRSRKEPATLVRLPPLERPAKKKRRKR